MNMRRTLAATTAINERWAHLGADERRAQTAPGRIAALRQFEDAIDPECKLDPKERIARAKNLQRAHMARLALARENAKREAARGAVKLDRRAQPRPVNPTLRALAVELFGDAQ